MLSAIIQLAGAVLLAILIFIRKEKDYYRLMTLVAPVIGQKSLKLLFAYRETWVIRLGLIFVIVGNLMQIIGVDYNVFTMNFVFIKLFVTIAITMLHVFSGYLIAVFLDH
jgi:hypothetical protein